MTHPTHTMTEGQDRETILMNQHYMFVCKKKKTPPRTITRGRQKNGEAEKDNDTLFPFRKIKLFEVLKNHRLHSDACYNIEKR